MFYGIQCNAHGQFHGVNSHRLINEVQMNDLKPLAVHVCCPWTLFALILPPHKMAWATKQGTVGLQKTSDIPFACLTE